jgi:hypothetical protein
MDLSSQSEGRLPHDAQIQTPTVVDLKFGHRAGGQIFLWELAAPRAKVAREITAEALLP